METFGGEELMFYTDAKLEEVLRGKEIKVYCKDVELCRGIVSKFLVTAKYNNPNRTICGIVVGREEIIFTSELKIIMP